MGDKERGGWSARREGEPCDCPDCRPCSDPVCMEIRRKEHFLQVGVLRDEREA